MAFNSLLTFISCILYYFKVRIRFGLLKHEKKEKSLRVKSAVGIVPGSNIYLSFSLSGFKATSRQVQKYNMSRKF
jgi:hypothetical protein